MTDVASETAALLRRDAEFAAAAAEGRDVDSIVTYWSTDAVVAPPGQPPVVGRDALRKYVADSLQIPGFNITLGVHRRPGIRALTIWRRDSDGQWRCSADIWNHEPQP